MKTWSLKELYKRLDWAAGGLDAKQLDALDGKAYNELLLQKAEHMFSNGRYSTYTEMSLEMYIDPEVETALHDLSQIAELTADERIKLSFYQDLKSFCFPLFRRKSIDLTQAPFCFSQGSFNIMNKELRGFLYETSYVHLAAVLCDALINGYWQDAELKDTIVQNRLSDALSFGFHFKERDEEKKRKELDELIDQIFTTENHLEVGKRLGLTPQAQAIYDMTDTFICKEYYYSQVDFAKEMDLWLQKNWNDEEPYELLVKELDACAQRHDVTFVDKSSTITYMLYDLLGMRMFPDSEYDDGDDEFLEDDF